MTSIIPITAMPNHRFSSKIPVDGKNLVLRFRLAYNELAGYWLVDISDGNGKALISSQPMLPAENILEQYEYLEIGSAYIIPAQTIAEEWPSRYTLGSDWYLVWNDTKGGDLYG